jgi:2-keto-4-pentenoate hydratase/2-oxohepta-3-ene-1,7-dioic acid hydratase in catechol pathway
MKIARCTDGKAPFWAVVDVAESVARPFHGAFAEWAPALTRGEGVAALRFTGEVRTLSELRFLPPIEKANKVVVAGANYRKHLVEFGVAPPSRPVAFLKAYGALIGATDPIRYPPVTRELDHEVELVAVIGAERIDHRDPYASLLGYTVGNDVSARDEQRSGPPGIGMDLFSAKSQDKTTGLGPWIVTRDEFPAGQPKLKLGLTVNGTVRQNGTTADMTWSVGELLTFIDARVSFDCGDILFTGTPDGVAQGSGKYLNPGDVVVATVEGIGTLRNVVSDRLA